MKGSTALDRVGGEQSIGVELEEQSARSLYTPPEMNIFGPWFIRISPKIRSSCTDAPTAVHPSACAPSLAEMIIPPTSESRTEPGSTGMKGCQRLKRGTRLEVSSLRSIFISHLCLTFFIPYSCELIVVD